jgi:hypothetical protein
MDGHSFAYCGLRKIEIEPGNPYFHAKGDFVMNATDRIIVRYFGSDNQVHIWDDLDAIGAGCFAHASVVCVTFGPDSRVSSVDSGAFASCVALKSICLPASVTCIKRECFRDCGVLQSVSWSPGSQLETLLARLFYSCRRLESILVPASVAILCEAAFSECTRLAQVTFETGSLLREIEGSAFWACQALRSICLPALLGTVGENSFFDCRSLVTMRFVVPSHLRSLLALPPRLTGVVDMPDSLEILRFSGEMRGRTGYGLQFGRESKLNQVSVDVTAGRQKHCFMRLSGLSLKRFRCNLEFAECGEKRGPRINDGSRWKRS